MRLSKTQAKVIVTFLGVLLSFGIYSGLFIVIKNKNNQISALQNQVDVEIRKDQRLRSIKQLIIDLREDSRQIDTYFVSKDGVVNFLEDLEALGSISDISVGVNSVSVGKNIDNEFSYELLKIEFAARGVWSSIIQLISLLETFSLGITIERMQLEKLPNSSFWQVNTSFSVLKLK